MCSMLQSDTLKKRAEKAKKKKATLGKDLELEQFESEEAGEHEKMESLEELSEKYKKDILKVGVQPTGTGRAGSFLRNRPIWSVYQLQYRIYRINEHERCSRKV